MSSPLIQGLFVSLLDSPISGTIEQAIQVIRAHFTFSGYEITKAYQDACRYSFTAISIGLDAPDSWLKKLRYPQVTREFAHNINEFYVQEFLQTHPANITNFAHTLKDLTSKTKLLFTINEITEEDLAALIGTRDNTALTELILQQLHKVVTIDDDLATFLKFKNLLGDSVLYFFRELLRQDERIQRTQNALQQERLCIDVQNIQVTIEELQATQAQYPFLATGIKQQLEYLQHWQTQHEQFIAIHKRFAIQFEQMADWMQDIKIDIAEINSKLDQILLAQQQTQSAKIEYLDGTNAYTDTNKQLITHIMQQLPELFPQYSTYGQITNKVARILSSMGALQKAEVLLQQLLNATEVTADKALAYFNLFQIGWRKALLTSNNATKEQLYAQALTALQQAIELDYPNQNYVLYDINTGYYPIQKFLGAGGMGCVFLCQNNNLLTKNEFPQVVVKCFWQTIGTEQISDNSNQQTNKAKLASVFKEPLAMHQLQKGYVPQILDYGYADNRHQTQAYFVTEYIQGAIDGEAWLEQYGPLDATTGVQVAMQIATVLQDAHAQNILHLDLKPSNLLLIKTQATIAVKLIDFGIAQMQSPQSKVATSHSGLTAFGQTMVGTWEYAAPEQRIGKPEAKSDIFAFGMTMYQLLTAKKPHPFAERHLPKNLRELLSTCVETEPKDRPPAQNLVKSFQAITDKQHQEEQEVTEDKRKAELAVEQRRKEQEAIEAKRKAKLAAEQRRNEQEAIEAKRKAKLAAEQRRNEQEAIEAKRKASEKSKDSPRKLSPWNPLDYLRFMWAVFVMPQILDNYEDADNAVRKGLGLALIYLPFLIPNLALGLGLLPISSEEFPEYIYLVISLVLSLFWLNHDLLTNSLNLLSIFSTLLIGVFAIGSTIAFTGVFALSVAAC
ncbi:hypothetical protein TI05_13635, partial [Achromatium sp. WMS3]